MSEKAGSTMLGARLRFVFALLVTMVTIAALAEPSPSGQSQNIPNLNAGFIDDGVSPTHDFYEFANGNWRKTHPIPPAYGRWAVFRALLKTTDQRIHTLLEKAASRKDVEEGTDLQRVADFYASGMDTQAINAAGVRPLRPELDRIARLKNTTDIQTEIGRLQQLGLHAAFDFGKTQDTHDASRVIGFADQGGLGMPDRSYYLATGKRETAIRDAYIRHIIDVLQLTGESPASASADAKRVMVIETALARASMARAKRRQPGVLYHPMDLAALARLTPQFDWQRHFQRLGRPDLNEINLRVPKFFACLNQLFTTQSLDTWKAYLRWRLLDGAAPYLSEEFVDANFRFRSRLTGATRKLPRWQRVVHTENRSLPFAVGRLYVQRYFPPEEKRQVEAIVRHVRTAFREEIRSLEWMSPATREQALQKEAMMVAKIGYPEHWPDHAGLDIDRGAWVLNVFRARAYQFKRDISHIGKPVDRNEWQLPPQMVDAYYSKSQNDITVPAGILQGPWFNPHAPAAINYGAIGSVIGHEITHGFDDQGRKYDGHGNLADWWTKDDSAQFNRRASCITDQYSAYTIANGTHVQGALVTGEAIADLGGIAVSYRAFHSKMQASAGQADRSGRYTPDQLFFLAFAHLWGSNVRPEYASLLAKVDPHPPMKDRVNGTLANFPPFQAAFGLPDDSPMVNSHRCAIW